MRVRILVLLALRSLVSHRVKSAIVGSIMAFGTFLVVTGSAVLDSLEASMARAITSSLSGHLQVYSADAEDELSLFGGFGMGTEDIGEIEDFSRVHDELVEVDNVAGVVPMGITVATVFGGNDIDRALDELRAAVRAGDREAIALLSGRVRQIAATIAKDLEISAALQADRQQLAQDREAVALATSNAFWDGFADDPYAALELLDTRVAPLAADGRMYYLRIIGTDLARFTDTFDRFYVVKGQAVPPGQRGLLLSDRTHEQLLKNLVARELDDVKEALDEGTTLAEDALLREKIERNAGQYKRVVFQLDPDESAALEPKLRALLPGVQGDLAALVQAFLRMDDANFAARYRFFYDEIAPRIDLYEVEVGDVLTLRAFTKSGYVKSVNVRVYGTYEFEGLEASDLASASNLADLVTWRELYGKMTTDQKAELEQIKSEVGVAEIARDDLESALFGGGGELVTSAAADAGAFEAVEDLSLGDRVARQEALDTKVYSRDEIEQGLALNAAIVLDDPDRIGETREAIEAKIAAEDLGLKVVDWQQASGLLGQFVTVMRLVLYAAIFVIFLVALVIINNSMVMATMERVAEIGTMRAIGARRGFVMGMFVVETIVLGVLAGGAGAALALGFVGWLGSVGIPAGSPILVVLFAGPRLYPVVNLGNIVFGFVVILVVSLLSTLYPARLASRVQPIVAMQGKE